MPEHADFPTSFHMFSPRSHHAGQLLRGVAAVDIEGTDGARPSGLLRRPHNGHPGHLRHRPRPADGACFPRFLGVSLPALKRLHFVMNGRGLWVKPISNAFIVFRTTQFECVRRSFPRFD